MSEGWWVVAAFIAGCLGYLATRTMERVWNRRHPPRDTGELLARIAPVAHSLIEARLTCAWNEAELAKIIDNLPPVFEDQVMLAAQLGQAIEQSVMREVQRQGIPIVRLSEARAAGYAGWFSKWLRREPVEMPSVPDSTPVVVEVPTAPQLPEFGTASVRPSTQTLRPPPPRPSNGPAMIFRPGVGWVPRVTR